MLGQTRTEFHQCSGCGFIQTDEPIWLPQAYSNAITGSDLGLVTRNIKLATICSALIPVLFPHGRRFVDYGGGYGLFVRLMRDAGFDFLRYDPLCENLFAQGLDAEAPPAPSYDLVTAFEVFEHLLSPLNDIELMLRFGRSIFFSTELVSPTSPPRPETWPYYGLEHGQHIAFYSVRTLQVIADRFGLRLYTNGQSLHLLTEQPLSARLFRLLLHHRVASMVRLLVKRDSLLGHDVHARLTMTSLQTRIDDA
jgi:hypothetical protein